MLNKLKEETPKVELGRDKISTFSPRAEALATLSLRVSPHQEAGIDSDTHEAISLEVQGLREEEGPGIRLEHPKCRQKDPLKGSFQPI